MADGPQLPVVERDVARIVVLDQQGRILLLNTRDQANPLPFTLWELPGGGMEPGESFVAAACRELREETGIVLDACRVGAPTWRRDVSYPYRGMRRVQHELISIVQLTDDAPTIEGSQRVDFETEDLIGFRWWTLDAIIGSSENFYPRSLPTLLPAFLAGENLDEPFEYWP